MKIGAIVWGVKDIERSLAFWKEALDYDFKYPPNEEWVALIPKEGEGVQFDLMKVTTDKAQRHHLDLFTEHQTEEVERLINLGATRVKWDYPEGADYVVLHDPDGNPFCVVQE